MLTYLRGSSRVPRRRVKYKMLNVKNEMLNIKYSGIKYMMNSGVPGNTIRPAHASNNLVLSFRVCASALAAILCDCIIVQ